VRVGRKFRLGGRIGSGSFGSVHLGTNVQTGEEIAIKLEPRSSRSRMLLHESKLYALLAGGIGVPRVHWYGLAGNYNAMVLDLLGPSLEDLFTYCHRRFSLKTVLMLADQIISRLEQLHASGFLHRDVKPENLVVGLGEKADVVHLIDLGLAKRYRGLGTREHVPYCEGTSLEGTARYSSINAHLGIEQSRRDDLEAVGHMLAYFSRGSLPWQGIVATSKREKHGKIGDKKMNTPVEVLCEDLPAEFVTYFKYCRGLRFEEDPDYTYLRRLFQDLFVREGYSCDFVFDWTTQHISQDAESDDSSTASARWLNDKQLEVCAV